MPIFLPSRRRPDPPAVCNIGRKQKRLRLIPAIVLFAVTGLSAYFSIHRELYPALRLLFFFPFFISILGFLQAKERTCVFFAFRRIRDLDEGTEAQTDPLLAEALIVKSKKMIRYSASLAAGLTFFCILA